MQRLKIDIRYDTELSLSLIDEVKPDMVVLATGSMPEMPLIKGLFQTRMELVTCVDIMDGKAVPGEKSIVLGGGMTGLITADFIASQGKKVVVLNRKKSFAEEMSSNDRYYLRERLKAERVDLFKNVSVQSFSDDGVRFTVQGEEIELTGFDMVVISERQNAIRDAKKMEKKAGIPFCFIGDAKSPRHLMYCISEAEELARSG